MQQQGTGQASQGTTAPDKRMLGQHTQHSNSKPATTNNSPHLGGRPGQVLDEDGAAAVGGRHVHRRAVGALLLLGRLLGRLLLQAAGTGGGDGWMRKMDSGDG